MPLPEWRRAVVAASSAIVAAEEARFVAASRIAEPAVATAGEGPIRISRDATRVWAARCMAKAAASKTIRQAKKAETEVCSLALAGRAAEAARGEQQQVRKAASEGRAGTPPAATEAVIPRRSVRGGVGRGGEAGPLLVELEAEPDCGGLPSGAAFMPRREGSVAAKRAAVPRCAAGPRSAGFYAVRRISARAAVVDSSV